MCTYVTTKLDVDASVKGAGGWFSVVDAMVYVDHPVHSSHLHTVNIDFMAEVDKQPRRVAIEMTEESARDLAKAIVSTIELAPVGLASKDADARSPGRGY